MFRRELQVCILLAYVAVAGVSAGVHPIYSRLKSFRTYLDVRCPQRAAHQFDVYFVAAGPQRVYVGADTTEAASAITTRQIMRVGGGMAHPPTPVTPVPAELEAVAAALRVRLGQLYPQATAFVFSYLGHYRPVWLQECIPVDRTGSATDRRAIRASIVLRLAGDSVLPGHHGWAIGGHSALLAWDDAAGTHAQLPAFLNYRMPADLEGTSLISGHLADNPAGYAVAFERMVARLARTVRAMDAGTYVNPIERLLSAQGGAVVPPRHQAVLEFPIHCHVDAFGQTPSYHEFPTFYFPARLALQYPLTYTIRSPRSGAQYAATLDLVRSSLTVVITNTASLVRRETDPLKPVPGGGVISGPEGVAVLGGELGLVRPTGAGVIELPGNGAGATLRVTPERAVRVHPWCRPGGATIGSIDFGQ